MILFLFFSAYFIFSFISFVVLCLNKQSLSISSGMPPVFDAITGMFAAKPSRITIPNGSYIDGTIKTSQDFRYSWTFLYGTFPKNVVLPVTCSFFASFFRWFSYGPLPNMIHLASVSLIIFITCSMPFHGTRRATEQTFVPLGSSFLACVISFAVYPYIFMPFGIMDIFFSFIFR